MYFHSRVRTARIGYLFMLPSPLCVTKISSRCVAFSPRSTGRNDRPLMLARAAPPIASRHVGSRSIQLTSASEVVPGLTTPGHTTTSGVRMPAS